MRCTRGQSRLELLPAPRVVMGRGQATMVCPSPTPARHRHGASWWWDSPGSRPARLGSRDQGRGFAIEQPSKIDRSAICHARGCARSEQKQLARDKQGRLSAEVFGRACATPAISPAATAGVTQRLGRVDVEGGGQSPDSLTRARAGGWIASGGGGRVPTARASRIAAAFSTKGAAQS